MPEDKKIILKLNTPILSSNNSVIKDASGQTKTQEELLKLPPAELTKIAESLPLMTVGTVLIGLINTSKIADLVQLTNYSTLLKKIQNKSKNNKGIWYIEKQELVDLENVFIKAEPSKFDVVIHGQVYNLIKDLLIKSV